jgi:hypothetical protein
MSSSARNKPKLSKEVEALLLSYGITKWQEALAAKAAKAAERSSSSKVAAKTNIINVKEFDISQGIRYNLDKILTWETSGDCSKMNIFVGEYVVPAWFWLFIRVMENYYDSIVGLRSQDPSHESKRVESRLHTLFLCADNLEAVERVLKRKKFVGLFEKVEFLGESDRARIDDDALGRINNLIVKEGVISSLEVSDFCLWGDDIVQFGKILEANRLESIELTANGFLISPFACPLRVGHAFKSSLQRHIHQFGQGSSLRVLHIDRIPDKLDSRLLGDLFHVIGNLPNLESFGVTTKNIGLLETLVDSIGNWKFRHFQLLWEFRDEASPFDEEAMGYRDESEDEDDDFRSDFGARDNSRYFMGYEEAEDVDFRPIFGAVASSRYLKAFTFGCAHGEDHIQPSAAEHLFELALSSSSGLVEINLSGNIHLEQLDSLIPENVDPRIAVRRQLRKFGFIRQLIENNDSDGEYLLPNLAALVRLTSDQLPYLHYIGAPLDARACLYFEDMLGENDELCAQVTAQLEKNRVGMGLVQPHVISTVPRGLWSIVLHRAVASDNGFKTLPWTIIYHMVRTLVLEECVGSSDGGCTADKRRKVQTD